MKSIVQCNLLVAMALGIPEKSSLWTWPSALCLGASVLKGFAGRDQSHALTLQTVLGIILGGGAGSRLYPLTKTRAKPAVPLGANYRLIDIPVSNCINSGVNKIYCLTQFNSASLNRHLSSAYVRPQSLCCCLNMHLQL